MSQLRLEMQKTPKHFTTSLQFAQNVFMFFVKRDECIDNVFHPIFSRSANVPFFARVQLRMIWEEISAGARQWS